MSIRKSRSRSSKIPKQAKKGYEISSKKRTKQEAKIQEILNKNIRDGKLSDYINENGLNNILRRFRDNVRVSKSTPKEGEDDYGKVEKFFTYASLVPMILDSGKYLVSKIAEQVYRDEELKKTFSESADDTVTHTILQNISRDLGFTEGNVDYSDKRIFNTFGIPLIIIGVIAVKNILDDDRID